MTPVQTTTRRFFLAQSTALGVVPRLFATRRSDASKPYVAYVGSSSTGLTAFRVAGQRWTRIQDFRSAAVSHLVMDRTKRFLYVANAIDHHGGLPSATVEAFSIDQSGCLAFLNRQSLSLSATRPRHLAVAPDDKAIIAAVFGGGAYNVLPIEEGGRLGRVAAISKEIGASHHSEYQTSAHPHTLVFDPGGRHLLATDFGADRLRIFRAADGKIARHAHQELKPGQGPGHAAFHPLGNRLYVFNQLDASVSTYGFDTGTGAIGQHLHRQPLSGHAYTGDPVGEALLIDGSGSFLYTLSAEHQSVVTSWKTDARSGALTLIHTASPGLSNAASLTMAPDRKSLLLLDRKKHMIVQLVIDEATGRLGQAQQVAETGTPVAVAFNDNLV